MEARITRGALVVTALGSALLASLATLALRGSQPDVGDPRSGDVEFAPLVAELRRLATTLARPEPGAVAPADAVTTPVELQRQQVAGIDADQRMASLLERIDLLIAELRSRPLGGGAVHGGIDPRVRLAGERWDSLEGFLALHRADPAEARRSILFLTAREIVERFGIPTDSGAGKGNMWMSYKRRDEGNQVVFNLYLSFADGIVMLYELEVQ